MNYSAAILYGLQTPRKELHKCDFLSEMFSLLRRFLCSLVKIRVHRISKQSSCYAKVETNAQFKCLFMYCTITFYALLLIDNLEVGPCKKN